LARSRVLLFHAVIRSKKLEEEEERGFGSSKNQTKEIKNEPKP
jgi:hypothetical protein